MCATANTLPPFRLKGERHYIHGTDIFDSVSDYLDQSHSYLSELTFRGFATHQLSIHLSKDELSDHTIVCQGKRVDKNKVTHPFFIVEGDTPTKERYGYDESEIGKDAAFTEDMALSSLNPAHTVIENVVAITKKLHNHSRPLSQGKWVFGQIRLTGRFPNEAHKLRLTITAAVVNRFTRSTIELDDKQVGEIRFIVSE